MDNNQTFWIKLWKVFGTILISLVLLGTGCYSIELHHEITMVDSGVSPMERECAHIVQSAAAQTAICLVWEGR